MPYEVRDVQPEDLVELDWSGGAEHIDALARAVQRGYTDEMAVLLITAGRSSDDFPARSVAVGAVDLTGRPGAGTLTMLSVRESWQSLGLGTILIAALEERVREHGLPRAVLAVEHDNPRAVALYQRLGYRRVGTELDGWPVGQNRTYVTVSFILERDL